jgi:uncharacterized protein YutE (UPF0331/DUF86 family)
MDKQLIAEKLETLRSSIKRIESRLPQSIDVLRSDHDIQDIITLNLTHAVQLCVDIAAHIIAETEAKPPSTMAETFEVLATLGILTSDLANRMRKAVGFRNVAVHNYQAVNWDIVYSICAHNLQDFKSFALAINDKVLTQ